MQTYKDKNVWIIGASSGIGEALAIELAASGARLALSARSKDKLTALVDKLDGDDHMVIPVDVSNASSLQNATQDIIKKCSKIDIVVFLAALYVPGSIVGDVDLEKAQQGVDVNYTGALKTVNIVVPVLPEGAVLALCGSVAGYRGLRNAQPYSSTKAAIINLAESLRLDLMDKKIDVKVINPGFVKTPLTDKNDFDMPMLIEASDAAKFISKGLLKKSFEIHFPKQFTFIMKLLAMLPYPVYFWIAKRMR